MSQVQPQDGLLAFASDEALKQLEEALVRFNLFEAIGATHKELWHSDFLAFLLNPVQNHGLGGAFTRGLLTYAVPDLRDIASFDEAVVRREHRYTDILIDDLAREISVIIENKIWSPEAPGQLAWYWDTITAEHSSPTWNIYGVFLTPKGANPSDPRYRPLSYKAIISILGSVLADNEARLNPSVLLVVQHYIDMLGRFIVGNADTEALARQLYFKHRTAIKLMDPKRWKSSIKDQLQHLVRETHELQSVKSDLEYIRFRSHAWKSAHGLEAGSSNTLGKPPLYFTVTNMEDSLVLQLWITRDVLSEMRARLLQLGESKVVPFCKPGKEADYWFIYRLDFLTKNDYLTLSDEDLKATIEARWRQFTEDDLPKITDALASADWFWNAPASP